MPASSFRVEVTDLARADLAQMQIYWEDRGEAWRGERYHRDLLHLAASELCTPLNARRGRIGRIRDFPDAREILAFDVYRIIYRIDEAAGIVNVLRFWHAHRDEPRRDA